LQKAAERGVRVSWTAVSLENVEMMGKEYPPIGWAMFNRLPRFSAVYLKIEARHET
jgi:hypothetical protein